MKKTTIILFCLILLIALSLHAKKVASLAELLKPGMMAVSDDKLFITDKFSILIYSLKDHNLIKRFGEEGEGPREFTINPFGPPMMIFLISDKLLINSTGKISFFTQTGEHIKEMKTPPFSVFIPVRDKYVGNGSTSNKNNQSVLTVNLYNSMLEKIKEFYVSDMTVGPGASFDMPFNPFFYPVYKEKIFIIRGKEGFVIDVFNAAGKKLYRIEKDFKPMKVTDTYKKKTMHWFKNESPFKQFLNMFKITFKSHFPLLKEIAIADNRIYIFTYKRIQKKEEVLSECIIMDLKGNDQKRLFLPLPEGTPWDSPLYTIQNHRFYTLVENEDNEEWELHMEVIK